MSGALRVFRELAAWQAFRRELGSSGPRRRSLGFVPTMGALHEGHASLIRRSLDENDETLVSIFVNPTQFNDPSDLAAYPRALDRDRELLERTGARLLFLPSSEELYPDHYRYRLSESEISQGLCGAHRPGHFDGMLTIVLKLLNLAGADRAYFGEKDYQQLLLVRGMAEALFLPTRIVGCPTARERDGLAMSSRNLRLSPAQRELAAWFPRLLRSPAPPAEIVARLRERGFEVDYIEEKHQRRLGAVRLGGVRLIDNFPLDDLQVPAVASAHDVEAGA